MAKKKKAKGKIAPTEKRLEHLDKVAPFRTCYICQRESRDAMLVSSMHARCASCVPGSYNWITYWQEKPKRAQPESVQFLLKHYCEA